VLLVISLFKKLASCIFSFHVAFGIINGFMTTADLQSCQGQKEPGICMRPFKEEENNNQIGLFAGGWITHRAPE
jgi:hypothetical protein